MKEAKQKKLNNKIHVIPSERSKQFIENFNKNKPTEEFIESCKKARELFGVENDKSTEQNVADVPIGDTISRQWLLDLYDIDTTNFKETAKVPLEVVIQNIKDAPSVSIQPKTIANDYDLVSRNAVVDTILKTYTRLKGHPTANHLIENIDALPSAELTLQTPQTYGKSINPSNAEVVEDLISRADAIEVGNKIIEELSLSSIDWDDLKYWAKELFEALPSADRPKGEWIAVEDDCENIYWECSNCEDAFYLEVGTPKSNNYNYCPNCGADMRGEK